MSRINKKRLLSLLEEGKPGRVLSELKLMMPLLNQETQKEIIQQSARFHSWEKNKRTGVLSEQHESIQLMKINEALIELIHLLYETPSDTSKSSSKNRHKSIIYIIVFIVIVALAGVIISGKFFSASNIKDGKYTSPSDSINQVRDIETTQFDALQGAEPNPLRNEYEIRQTTTGDQSPAVIGRDVIINFEK